MRLQHILEMINELIVAKYLSRLQVPHLVNTPALRLDNLPQLPLTLFLVIGFAILLAALLFLFLIDLLHLISFFKPVIIDIAQFVVLSFQFQFSDTRRRLLVRESIVLLYLNDNLYRHFASLEDKESVRVAILVVDDVIGMILLLLYHVVQF